MDKSSKAVEAALARVHEVKAACKVTKKFTVEYDKLIFLALPAAEAAYLAALRAEKIPRADCAACQRRFKRDEPMVWQWRPSSWGHQSVQLCLRCVRSEHKGDHAERLAELDQQPCEACARTMYFDGFSSFHRRRPLNCSYQCGYRRKLKHQLERKRAEHATVACVVCGEMFTQRRSDAQTCSNACRQKLFRRQHRAQAR